MVIKNLTKIKLRLFFIGLVAIVFFLVSVYLTNKYIFKPQATRIAPAVKVSFSPSDLGVRQLNTFKVDLIIEKANSYNFRTSGIDLSLKFDEGKDLIEYRGFEDEKYFDDKIIEKVINKNGAKILNLVLVAKKKDNELKDRVVISLNFFAKNSGTGKLQLIRDESQISGLSIGSAHKTAVIDYNQDFSYKIDSLAVTPRISDSPCPKKPQGDANCDGKINLQDFEVWRKEYLGIVTAKNSDFNRDNKVDLKDFEIWRVNYVK